MPQTPPGHLDAAQAPGAGSDPLEQARMTLRGAWADYLARTFADAEAAGRLDAVQAAVTRVGVQRILGTMAPPVRSDRR